MPHVSRVFLGVNVCDVCARFLTVLPATNEIESRSSDILIRRVSGGAQLDFVNSK